MTYLGVPFQYMWVFNNEQMLPTEAENIARGKVILEEKVIFFSLAITGVSIVAFIGYFTANKMWNWLGTNLTV